MKRQSHELPVSDVFRSGSTDRAGVRLRGTTSRIVTVRFFDGRLVSVPIRNGNQRQFL